MKKHLGVACEWGKFPNDKAFCKATMKKKIEALITSCEKFVGQETKMSDDPGKLHEYLSKSEDDNDPNDIGDYR